jgi:uncharacterized membrane protein YecN with MAPEG domain
MNALDIAALVTALAIFLYEVVSFKVGRARAKYGVNVPATSGPEAFERVYRVQMNTLEQLVFFLPALWLCAFYMPKPWLVGGFGAGWILGRILYAVGYYHDASKRFPGFIIALFSANALLLAGLFGIIESING